MDRAAESGLEVKPSTGPQVIPQPDANMYYVGGAGPNGPVFGQLNQSDSPKAKSPGRSRVIWVLAGIAVICLAVGIGAGLGAGLAAQHKSSSSSLSSNTLTKAGNDSATIIQTRDAPVTITQSADLTTTTPTPATLPSPTCPAANGFTYVATNKPLQTPDPYGPWQITNTSLSFEIFCNTNFRQKDSVLDLQVLQNISSLNDCLDQCALYNFHTSHTNFPALGCTGIAWNMEPYDLCWLKSNVTLGSPNGTTQFPEDYADGAVLLGI